MHEIANVGLGAPTAKIARRAGVAAGTLFTYFANKEELLNELYVELKGEVYTRINANFPNKGSPERSARHICSSVLNWAIEFPEKRKAAVETGSALCGLPPGFATTTMAAMQEATMEFIAKQRKQREQLLEQAFQVFWRAVR